MEDNNNAGLLVLRAMKKTMDKDGRVYVDENELCRLAGVSASDLRESLFALERLRIITTETICTVSEEWR